MSVVVIAAFILAVVGFVLDSNRITAAAVILLSLSLGGIV